MHCSDKAGIGEFDSPAPHVINQWYDYSPEQTVTVTEREYDERGNIVKETVTVTRKPNRPYPYPYTVTYSV